MKPKNVPRAATLTPKEVPALTPKEAEVLHEALQPQDAPTPKGSKHLGAKEEQVSPLSSPQIADSDAPGG